MPGRDELPELLRRMAYDPRLEARALAQLEQGQHDECRETLERMVARLRVDDAAGGPALVVALLADVLQRVNRRLQGRAGDPWNEQANRLAILRWFAACSDLDEARKRFSTGLRQLLEPVEEMPHTIHPQVARAVALLEASFPKRLSLSVVAHELGLSPSYLSRLFRRDTGLTLTRYLQRVRLGHALRLLAASESSCAEIAYRVGYQSYRDFHRNVVRLECASPRELRRRLRAAPASPD